MKRRQIRTISDKRREQLAERAEVRTIVAARAGHACQYKAIIPEIPCATRPGRHLLEVDELRGGAHRCIEWLNPDACRLACPAHHDWKTDHKAEVLRRLAEHEGDRP